MYSPLARDDVEVDAGAEVDHHARPAEALVGGHGVHQPVGADLARVVDPDRHPGPQARAHHGHLVAEVALGHRRPLRPQLRARSRRRSTRRVVERHAAQARAGSAARAPSSSAVDSRTVAKRQCSTSSPSRNVPKWVCVLPTSTTSSISQDGARYAPARRRRARQPLAVAGGRVHVAALRRRSGAARAAKAGSARAGTRPAGARRGGLPRITSAAARSVTTPAQRPDRGGRAREPHARAAARDAHPPRDHRDAGERPPRPRAPGGHARQRGTRGTSAMSST